jgi:flagellar hook assembly protein FlgD
MGIDDETIVAEPVQITLYNYPNPFKTETKISYVLHQAGLVNLEIYNVKGQKIKSLSMGEKKAGLQSLSWDGRDSKGNPCASGVYFCKMQFNNKSVSKKLILMK